MAKLFHVSIQNKEKDLSKWIQEMIDQNKISPSLVFRDAMIEKKKEFDAFNSGNPESLKKHIESLRETITKQSEAFEILPEEWKKKTLDFMINYEKKQKSQVQVEKIVEDHSKEKKESWVKKKKKNATG